MKSYLAEKKLFKKFQNKEFCKFSLCAKDYRELSYKNKNEEFLKNLINKKIKGCEVGSKNYLKKSKYRFLKTTNIQSSFLIDESFIEYTKPLNKIIQNKNSFPKKNNILIAKDGKDYGLGESCLYPYENKGNKDFISAGILCLDIREEYLFYIFGILQSQFFKDFIDINTSQGSTIRHSKEICLDFKIPFPIKENNKNPKDIENLISLIVQNIIDKEEKINEKNILIDNLIEKELEENQKENQYYWSHPKISELKKELRLDTGIYEREFKNLAFQTLNYKNGYSSIEELGFNIKRGQNLQKTCIGETYYSNYPKKGFVPLITSTNINFSRQILDIRYIGNKNRLLEIQENDIMIAATGVNTGKVYIFPEIIKNAVSNINSFFLTSENKLLSIFTGLFLSYLSQFGYCKKVVSQSNGGSILEKDVKSFNIPNFPEFKQQEIAKLYHNPLDKNLDLNFENYLETEIERNSKLGIFQLNMELFDLKEILKDLIDKIIMNKKIEINFNY